VQTLKINLPEGLNITERDALSALAIRLYDTGKVTIDQAAELAGYDLSTFIEELMAQSLQENSALVYQY
jgi:predicted HTH domain antitoxin